MRVASKKDAARAMRCLEALPSRYRQPLQMRLDGVGYEAIARELGIGMATVRKRVSRALGMLRDEWV